MLSRIIASMFGLAGFATALLAGLGAGNSAFRTLLVALVAMVICHIVGYLIGAIADSVARDRPVPATGGQENPPVMNTA